MTLHRGRIGKSVEILGIRELTRDDLTCLREPRQVSAAQKLRDPHHRLARLIASGIRLGEAADRAGYSYSRAAVLHADPTFQDLVANYRKQVDAAFVQSQDEYYDLATSNMRKAERMIAEKLEAADAEGETLPTRDLIAISRDAADRFGYGKKQTNLNVNVDFAAKLEKAIQRSSVARGTPPVIEGNLVRKI